MIAENLSLQVGGPALTMLIKEHNLICQIRTQDTGDLQNDVINEVQMPLIIGLAELQISDPSEMVLNNQGSFIIVSNLT